MAAKACDLAYFKVNFTQKMNDDILLLIIFLIGMFLIFGFTAAFQDPRKRRSFGLPPSHIVPPVIFRIGGTRSDGTLTVPLKMVESICNASTAWSRQRTSLKPNTPERLLFDRIVTLYTFGGYSIDDERIAVSTPQFPPQPPLNCLTLFFDSQDKPSSAIFGARARCPSLVLALCALRSSSNIKETSSTDSVLAKIMYPSFSYTHHDVNTIVVKRNEASPKA